MRNCLVLLLIIMNTNVYAATHCDFQQWGNYRGSKLLKDRNSGAYIYATSHVKVDADGAPNAYHPDDVGLHCTESLGFKGLDCPENGGYPNKKWWRSAIVPDPLDTSKGYVQKDGDFKGFFISKTSLIDKTKPDTDIQKYVSSTDIPYVVFPGSFYEMNGTGVLGDFGYAVNISNGKSSAFIVAEIGPSKASLGEISIALANYLGGSDPNPRTGAGTPKGKIAYIIFPRSKLTPSWPVSKFGIEDRVRELMDSVGGDKILIQCADSL